MNTKHKDYDIIVAWANGEAIQCLYPDENEWVDIFHTPDWLSKNKYRIKPKPEYPKTLINREELLTAYDSVSPVVDALVNVANAAIRHAIDSGQVIIAPKEE